MRLLRLPAIRMTLASGLSTRPPPHRHRIHRVGNALAPPTPPASLPTFKAPWTRLSPSTCQRATTSRITPQMLLMIRCPHSSLPLRARHILSRTRPEDQVLGNDNIHDSIATHVASTMIEPGHDRP
jgi:hypothetical protein